MSSAVTFPPAPNWYCAHAVSALGSACAYAANRDVVLVWHRRSPEGDRPDYPAVRTFRAFEAKAKLVALDLGRAPSEEAGAGSSSMLLATTSEDGLVRAWKVDCGGQEEDYQEPSTCREHDVHREGARDVSGKRENIFRIKNTLFPFSSAKRCSAAAGRSRTQGCSTRGTRTARWWCGTPASTPPDPCPSARTP